MTTKSIDEIGDITAPPGSKSWAIGVKNKLIYLIHQRKSTESHIAPHLELLEQYEGYKQLENEQGCPFGNLEDFIKARYPFGLDDDERLQHWLGKAKERVARAASETTGEVLPRGNPTGANQYDGKLEMSKFDISKQFNKGQKNGISRATQNKLDYLARNSTDLLHAVQNGELSADRAYKMARGVKDPSALDNLQKWWQKATQQERIAFLEWVQ